jgi:peptidoglycan hydrolase CwlO-like protein
MSLDSSPSDDEERRIVKLVPDVGEVRAVETDKRLDKLNDNVLDIGQDIKTLVNEVRGLKEAINNLANIIDSSK